jgi:GNAT superfamily N-acetyltransferase
VGLRAQLTVREASEQDWPAIWLFFGAIVRAGESFGYDTDMGEAQARAMWLDGPPSRTIVATHSTGEVRGSANLHRNRGGPGSHVASATFVVDPEHQGRGVGRALVEESLAWARVEGYRAMQFNAVVETNTAAVRLYESLGFQIIGTVPEGFLHPRHGYVGLHIMYRRA